MSKKAILLASLATLLVGQVLAADLGVEERRRLDREVLEDRRDSQPPRFSAPRPAPPPSYARRGTARICVDDADGVTCSYKNFPMR